MERSAAGDGEPDAILVRRVVAGDVDLFARLVDRHGLRVRRLVARNVPRGDAAEVAHDAFVAAYLSLSSYVETHPFEHWLIRIALRSCADYWRARGRRGSDEPPARLETIVDPMATSTDDDRELCEWALGQLEREDREVLTLVYFDALSTRECAQVLSWSEVKVKVRAHRARARLRRILRRVVPEERRRA